MVIQEMHQEPTSWDLTTVIRTRSTTPVRLDTKSILAEPGVSRIVKPMELGLGKRQNAKVNYKYINTQPMSQNR